MSDLSQRRPTQLSQWANPYISSLVNLRDNKTTFLEMQKSYQPFLPTYPLTLLYTSLDCQHPACLLYPLFPRYMERMNQQKVNIAASTIEVFTNNQA